jgi:hypothetical protein
MSKAVVDGSGTPGTSGVAPEPAPLGKAESDLGAVD